MTKAHGTNASSHTLPSLFSRLFFGKRQITTSTGSCDDATSSTDHNKVEESRTTTSSFRGRYHRAPPLMRMSDVSGEDNDDHHEDDDDSLEFSCAQECLGGGESEDVCGVVAENDDTRGGETRKVRFCSSVVSEVHYRPANTEEEKKDLYYTAIDYARMFHESMTEKALELLHETEKEAERQELEERRRQEDCQSDGDCGDLYW